MKKVIAVLLIVLLNFLTPGPLFSALPTLVHAQEEIVTEPTLTPEPSTEPSQTPAAEPTLSETPQPTEEPAPTASPTEAPTPTATPESTQPDWTKVDDSTDKTTNTVAEGKDYKFRDTQVNVHFNKVTTPGHLTIKEVKLSDEEKTKLGATSNTAYDISSDMPDGTFSYDLTLPNPNQSQNVTVKYSEDGSNYQTADSEKQNDTVMIRNLDHFTLFVITSTNLATTYVGSWIHYPTQGYLNTGVNYPTTIPSGQTTTWTFSSLPAGPSNYDVYISWSTHTNRTTVAPYTLNHNSGSSPFTINQEKLSDQVTTGGSGQWSGWYKLPGGPYSLTNTSNLVLTSIDNSSGTDYVIADAVAIVDDPATAPNTVWVNGSYSSTSANDYHIWGYDAFNTIQGGINAVASGGTINVAAGTYTEQLTISKSLHLNGSGQATTTVQAPGALVTDSNGAYDLVEIQGGSNVEINGFTIAGPGPSVCGSLITGIVVLGASTANIHDNTIKDIRDNPMSGCQNGVAILVGRKAWTTTGTATITNNTITGYQKGGIVVDNTGSSSTISVNTVTGVGPTSLIAQNGIQISRGATGTIDNNTISNNFWTGTYGGTNDPATDPGADGSAGILLYSAGSTEVKNNTLSNDQFEVWSVGSSNINVHNNNLTGSPSGTGFAIWDSDQWSGGVEVGTVATVSNNNLNSLHYGLLVRDYTPGGATPSVTAHGNVFRTMNTAAWSNVVVNATGNDWGVYLYQQIENIVTHNCSAFKTFSGLSGLACNSQDSTSYGKVNYLNPLGTQKYINFVSPTSGYYGQNSTISINVNAVYQPYDISWIKLRYAPPGQTCQQQYTSPYFHDLGNGVRSGDNYTGSWNITGLSSGNYLLCALMHRDTGATDEGWLASNHGEVSLTIDNVAPTASWVTPVDGDTISGTASLQVNASDDFSGVASVTFQYKRNDGIDSFHDIATVSGPYSTSWDTTALPLDAYTIQAVVKDNAGNETDVTETVNIAAVITNLNGVGTGTDQMTITWNTDRPTDSRVVFDTTGHPGLDRTHTPNYDFSSSTGTSDSGGTTSHTVILTGLTDGTRYYFRAVSSGGPVPTIAISDQAYALTLGTTGAPGPSGGGGGGQVAGASTTNNNTGNGGNEFFGTNVEELGATPSPSPSPSPTTTPSSSPTASPEVLGASTQPFNWWYLAIPGFGILLLLLFFLLRRNKKNEEEHLQ